MFWTNMPVSYLPDGTIDWAALEDEIPDAEDDMEFAREIQKLDFSQPQPSNLHPYFHQHGGPRLHHDRTLVQLPRMPRTREHRGQSREEAVQLPG